MSADLSPAPDDPPDLVARRLGRELHRLRRDNARLQRLLGLTGPRPLPDEPVPQTLFAGMPGPVDAGSSPVDKMRLFRALFAGRDDVYAVRWRNDRTDRAGWMPAVQGGFRREQANRVYLPLTDEVLKAHLTGDIHAGLYPLLPGDDCRLLACDFDGSTALLDALAYIKAARATNVPTALEISQSGAGAHVWMFFTGPVPATTARRVGAGLLREAIAIRGELDLASYDRFFPAQDYLPASGSIGNLIALPLHGGSRKRGTTLFIDLGTLEPHTDQFDYLSHVERLTPRRMADLAEQMRPLTVGPDARRLHSSAATAMHPAPPPVIRARLGAGIAVERAGLPPALLASLKHAASLHNPEFYQREKRRLSTYGVPRFIRCYTEDLDWLHLPRGLREVVEELVTQAGSRLELADDRAEPADLELTFAGQLSTAQQHAVDTLLGHELGVLEAPPGAGKTVVGCAVIASTGQPTLILVDRTALLDQWRAQVHKLIGVKPGQLGGGRKKRTGVIDLASLQTLARRDDLGELLAGYGLVIADECHHLPAATIDRAVRQLPARRWLGLTATPYRSDGLDPMILMQCGPVRHRMPAAGDTPADGVRREVFVHETAFTYDPDADPSAPGVIHDIYRAMIHDEERNAAIVADVRDSLARGRHCLILTNQTAHVDLLASGLRAAGREPVLLYGKLGAKARRTAVDTLTTADGGTPLLAVATGPYIGEGFDCPALDTVFLVFPIKAKGRIVQYVGRVLRQHPGKTSVEVHDYVDPAVSVLAYTHKQRCAGYARLGFAPPLRV